VDIFLCHQIRKCSKTNEIMSKGQKSQLEGALTGYIWDSLSIKKIMTIIDYNA
jgi:hypothetical protein